MDGEQRFAVGQYERQQQTLSPQMRESLKMLQLSAPELRAELMRQMEANPAIEDVDSPREIPLSVAAPDDVGGETAADQSTPLDFTPSGAAAEKILGANDGHLDYFLGNMESASGDEEADGRRQRMFDSVHAAETLQEHLLAQVPLSDIAVRDRRIAEMLIGDVDDDGRFSGSFADVEMVAGVDERRVKAVQTHILKFDPAGCCARDLRECLAAQLDKLDDSPWQNEVRKIVLGFLPDVAAGRRAKVCAALGVDESRWGEIIAALRTLNPRPGRDRRFAPLAGRTEYVAPEIAAVRKDGRWTAVLDERDLPTVRLSPRFRAILENPQATAEEKAYVRERIRAAEALLEAVERRQETIRKIAQEAFDAQPDVFERGFGAVRPLTRQQVAEKVGVHPSTVSRTVDCKYVRTPFGVAPLSKFFAAAISEGGVSNDMVRLALRKIVDGEDKSRPLSDEAIAARLKADGMPVARRTVAKYRSQLGIPGTGERRRA